MKVPELLDDGELEQFHTSATYFLLKDEKIKEENKNTCI